VIEPSPPESLSAMGRSPMRVVVDPSTRMVVLMAAIAEGAPTPTAPIAQAQSAMRIARTTNCSLIT
jgi:hypothetical protein